MQINKVNIVFLDAYTNNPGDIVFDPISKLGNLNTYDRTDEKDLKNRCEEAEIVIVNKFPVNEITLAKMPNLKFIVVAATGYNNISIDVVKNRNIPVSNVKGYSAESVTQHVFASIFALLNKLDYYNHEVRNGRWSACPDFCFFDHSITEIAGKVMGIFGYGSIGKRVAEVAFAFGMNVFVTARTPIKNKPDYINEVDKETLFKESDFLSLHCPLTNDTKEMINKDNLNKMKKQAILINTARGALINENDLLYALENGIISAAIIDVMNVEPPIQTNPLLTHPKCMVTPHLAWASQASRIRLMQGVADNIAAYLNGKIVNCIY